MTAITERTSRKIRRFAWVSAVFLLVSGAAALADEKPEVPEINGRVGSCSANFTVTDSEKKPIYNAKIEVVIRYGALGLHKTDLQVGTNSDGKARVIGLPEKTKKPLDFRITSGEIIKIVAHDPTAKCNATIDVVLGAN
jgi:hypothetical protein